MAPHPTSAWPCLQGVTTEELARELAIIVADQPAGTEGDPRVSAAQYVAGMARMTAHLDDPAFGRFVAQSLMAYRCVCGSNSNVVFLRSPRRKATLSPCPGPAPPGCRTAPRFCSATRTGESRPLYAYLHAPPAS